MMRSKDGPGAVMNAILAYLYSEISHGNCLKRLCKVKNPTEASEAHTRQKTRKCN